MKIAIAMEYPLTQQGGTEVLVKELLRGLRRDFEIVLVTGDATSSELPAEFLPMIAAHYPWIEGKRSAHTARCLAKSLKSEGVVLAHFHFGGTYEWQSKRFWRSPIYYLSGMGVKCLSTNHLAVEWLNCGCDPKRPYWQKFLLQAFAWINRAVLYRRMESEIAVSIHDQKRLHSQFPIFKDKISQRYHSLLCEDGFEPNFKEREPVVLCVGTLGGRKAQGNLVEAFGLIARRHADWRLDLVGREGKAQDVERIRARIKADGTSSQIHLLGRLSDEETVRRMQNSSIIAMPSLQEGLGLSLQEALFYGCVPVGSRAGGIPELIDDDVNGILVPAGDVPALSAALDKLMSDRNLLDRLRTQASVSVLRKGMTARAMLDRYVQDYRQRLAGK